MIWNCWSCGWMLPRTEEITDDHTECENCKAANYKPTGSQK